MATAADILGLNRSFKIAARWAKHLEWLSAERDRLLARDCSAPETSMAKMDDPGDAAAEESQRCLALVSASATQASIVDVLEAIRRIERGTYGICEMTGQPIEAERLRAIPWARYSIQGQQEAEKAGFGRRHALPGLHSLAESAAHDGEETADSEENEKEETEPQTVAMG
jgi:RNA polymerase-binding transcription factor DksA